MLGGAEFLSDRAMSVRRVQRERQARPADEAARQAPRPDDIAIIDHAELDRVSAEELVESGVRVVVNVAPSISGRFPNPGPLELVRSGVCLIDAPGAPLFEQVRDGEVIAVRGASLFRGGTRVADRARAPQRGARADPRGAAGPRDRGARGVRRQHDALPARGGKASHRGHRAAAAQDALPRPACARRRPRARATRRISRSSAPTSGTSSRCSSRSTGAPTRCSRPGTARTSSSATWTRSRTTRSVRARSSSSTPTRTARRRADPDSTGSASRRR